MTQTPAGFVDASKRETTRDASLAGLTIFVLTVRAMDQDFRFPLARELSALGADVRYVFLRRRPRVVALRQQPMVVVEMGIAAFATYMRQARRSAPRFLVLNSTNLVFPVLTTILRQFVGGVWYLDLHDDLLYEHAGWRRLKASLALGLLRLSSDVQVHAAPTLKELFPHSRRLGNASDMRPLERACFNDNEVLILASLDGRFDFALVSEIVARCPDFTFHLYGQVSKGNTRIRQKLEGLLLRHSNVTYHGSYSNDDLPGILQAYDLTLAPYVVGSRLTRYIDPLRFYHCLNSGMEVVTTDIPAARDLEPRLWIIKDAEAAEARLRQLAAGAESRRGRAKDGAIYDWRSKAETFLAIARQHRSWGIS